MKRLRWRVRRWRYGLWLVLNQRRDGSLRPLALRCTQLRMDLRTWVCAHRGHRYRTTVRGEQGLSGLEWCHRCWQASRGTETPYDRREHWLWRQRVDEILARHDSGARD